MKILMCSVPDGSLRHTLKPLLPRNNHWQLPILPIGILRIMSWMEKNNYDSDIYDINNLRPPDEKLIEVFKLINPTVVGLSATLTHCYPNTKRITKILRKLFPNIWIIVGGHLTGSSNVLLDKTETDICVIGDGELPFVKLLDYFKLHPTRKQINYTELNQIKGLAFIDENHKLKVTGNSEQLSESELTHPDLNKLKKGLKDFGGKGEFINEFFETIKKTVNFPTTLTQGQSNPEGVKFYERNENKKIGLLQTVRGCVARCSFCQRYTRGYRVYAANDLETRILELKNKYNVRALMLDDENSLSNRIQSYQIARILKKHDIFWSAAGVRVTSVTYEDLKFYKEHNMLSIRFGIETGSQKILDIMEKKFTVEDVYNAISNCKKVGMSTATDQLMLGMPGETRETVIESAKFVASLKFLLEDSSDIGNPFWASAIPGTPLYEYCQQIGVIEKTLDGEENYLIRSSEHKHTPILNYVNKTDWDIKEVHFWSYLYPYAGKKEYVNLIIKNNKSIKNKLLKIYKLCIKGSLNNLIGNFNRRKDFYKNEKFLKKMKWYIILSINFLLSLSVTFLPKVVLFSIIRVYANIRFFFLKKNNKVKKGKQISNFFKELPDATAAARNFRINENKIAKTNRQIDRSLRTVVMNNRKQMKPPITDDEKGLQILAQGQ